LIVAEGPERFEHAVVGEPVDHISDALHWAIRFRSERTRDEINIKPIAPAAPRQFTPPLPTIACQPNESPCTLPDLLLVAEALGPACRLDREMLAGDQLADFNRLDVTEFCHIRIFADDQVYTEGAAETLLHIGAAT
jgi:hypothetical protein